MALYVVTRRNPYWPTGTWVERHDQGVQKVRTRTKDGRLEVVGHVGILIPFSEIASFVFRVQKFGLDKPELRRYKKGVSPVIIM